MGKTIRFEDDDTGLTARQRRKVQRQRMLATYSVPSVHEEMDDHDEAERLVRGMLGRGQ